MIYTKSDCQPCRLTKLRFATLHIPYEEIELDDTATAYIKSLGYTAAPVVEADYGEGVTTSWSGFRPESIRQLKATL